MRAPAIPTCKGISIPRSGKNVVPSLSERTRGFTRPGTLLKAGMTNPKQNIDPPSATSPLGTSSLANWTHATAAVNAAKAPNATADQRRPRMTSSAAYHDLEHVARSTYSASHLHHVGGDRVRQRRQVATDQSHGPLRRRPGRPSAAVAAVCPTSTVLMALEASSTCPAKARNTSGSTSTEQR